MDLAHIWPTSGMSLYWSPSPSVIIQAWRSDLSPGERRERIETSEWKLLNEDVTVSLSSPTHRWRGRGPQSPWVGVMALLCHMLTLALGNVTEVTES